jgi:hypothetical protein
MLRVVLEVNGRSAEVIEKPAGVEVQILDLDPATPLEVGAIVEPAHKIIEADPCGHRTDTDHEETPRKGRSYCVLCGDTGDLDAADPIARFYHGDSLDEDCQAGATVTVLVWSHKHGREVTVHATLELALRAGAAIVEQALEDATSLGRQARRRVRLALHGGCHEQAIRLYHELLANAEDSIEVVTCPVLA